MTERLLIGLTELWEAALDARRSFSPGSPVPVLERLPAERRSDFLPGDKIISPDSPQPVHPQKSGSVPVGRNPF